MVQSSRATVRLRSMAADAYIQGGRNPQVAAEILKEALGGNMPLSKPAQYCKKWGCRRLETHTVNDAPRSCRPKKLTRDGIDQVITALSQGWVLMGANEPKKMPYSSWSQFCRMCPTAIRVLQATGVTRRHLLRACQATLPSLKRKKIQLRVWLKPETKAERVATSQHLLGKTKEWFESVVWVDAKTLYICPKSAFAWINTADMMAHSMLVREDRRVRTKPSQLVKLKFYIAVSALVGPVCLVFTTGTTGMPANRVNPPYTVSLT